MNNNEWLSRNPPPSRKRDRRSYDNNWGAYEARAGNNFRRDSSGFHSRPQGLSADGIIVEGERAGVPHGGGYNAGCQQAVVRGPQAAARGGASASASSSRIRVADYRGSAARVGALPSQDRPPVPYNQPTFSPKSKGGNNQARHSTFASSLLKSLTNPPAITVTLPPDLRSTLNKEQCEVVESILSGHSTFFTGPAGSGKSHVLKSLLTANGLGLGNDGTPRRIVVTATTGVSACNIGVSLDSSTNYLCLILHLFKFLFFLTGYHSPLLLRSRCWIRISFRNGQTNHG